jgi:hypothetical protein
MKVILRLSFQNDKWRENTVFMLDNASYHRSNKNLERYQKLNIPIMFLGPYHFKMAPAELMLSYIKHRNLNPLNSNITSK